MKMIVVGSSGTIGKAVVAELAQRHEVISVAHRHGDIQININDPDSIHRMYKAAGPFDALVSTAGKMHLAHFSEMDFKGYQVGLNDKLMGQVNLVLIGRQYINPLGSFTLTSGIADQEPFRHGSSAAMVNAAINGFVKGAAVEMPPGLRINAISPTILTESMVRYSDYFHGFESVSASRVALAYSRSVEGVQTGQVYTVK